MASLLVFILFCSLLRPSSGVSSLRDTIKNGRQVITAKHGAVATDDGRCSRIGSKVLQEGGNAVDASIASAFCLGVVGPASSGIGGGSFMLVRLANGSAHAFDMRETAPLRASQDMYAGNEALKASGALSIAVPGELAGLYKVWEHHGKLPWERLVRPAERLAEKGFRISPYLHMQMEKTKSGILRDIGLRNVFTSNGKLLQPGSRCRNKKLARTLRLIIRHGSGTFYNGSTGINLVNDVQKIGGILTMEDLKTYEIKVRKPTSVEVLGYQILGMPPPSSGGAAMALILNILSEYGVPKGVSGTLGVHRFIEAVKHAFAVRMNLGDPEFIDVSKVMSDMLSIGFAKELKKTIFDNMTFSPGHYGGRWNQIHDHGTSHLSIVDRWRNAVSMTSTVNAFFGSQFLSPSTGILLNNEMDDFSIPVNGSNPVPPPAPANFIRPCKRPLSSMAPTVVLKDGQLQAVLGSSGGSKIIPATAEVWLNHFARGMDPLSSVMAPRTFHKLIPNVLFYENWTAVNGDHFEVPLDTRRSLQKKGHVLESTASETVCQLVLHKLKGAKEAGDTLLGKLTAVSDPRKGGFPYGYS